MTADTGEEGKNGKINFYPGHLVFQSTSKGVLTAQDYRGVCQCEVGRLANDHW